MLAWPDGASPLVHHHWPCVTESPPLLRTASPTSGALGPRAQCSTAAWPYQTAEGVFCLVALKAMIDWLPKRLRTVAHWTASPFQDQTPSTKTRPRQWPNAGRQGGQGGGYVKTISHDLLIIVTGGGGS